MCLPFQGLKTITNMARDSSPQLASAPKSFCKNVTWENCDDLGSLGKAFSLSDMNLSSGALAFDFLFVYFKMCMRTCFWRSEKGIRPFGAGVRGDCTLADMNTGNQIQSSTGQVLSI